MQSARNAEVKPRAKRMSPEARQQQILDAGIEAFAERGLANATHADIAEKIGVSIPTIFHYYPNIENLQASVLKEIHKYFIKEMIAPRLAKEAPAYERIEEILLSFQGQIDSGNHRHYVTIWLEWSGFTRGFIWEMYLEFYKEAVNGLRRLLKQGVLDASISRGINAGDAARVIMGMAHTIAHMRFAGSSKRTVKNTVHSLVMSYLAPE
ncbi:TetR/AcrR family transcriptional regulator [Spongiibacter sp. KMU-166]|uniref:TetR/AcrR family transcriptional regulator n=1 Tax=Spongiibacter thalassae TaxID=2721624 RepID=A0ABX1GLG7_9GAMM|nr:TetR/AcrR family transcriptional regulator [Spongiibacter thalassae]NKI19282.1 TetR/AcrR family transcriptional regulator [Spongiibacter thalassae]